MSADGLTEFRLLIRRENAFVRICTQYAIASSRHNKKHNYTIMNSAEYDTWGKQKQPLKLWDE